MRTGAAGPPSLPRTEPAGTTALPGAEAAGWPEVTDSGSVTLTSRVTDPELVARAMPDGVVPSQQLACSESIDTFVSGVGRDVYLEETAKSRIRVALAALAKRLAAEGILDR
jgi:hypothetical protein